MQTIDRGPCLRRPSFLDRDFDPAELSALGEFFFQAFRSPENPIPAGQTYYRVESTLFGFARNRGPSLREELGAASLHTGFSSFEFVLPNPDVITAATPWEEPHIPFPIGALANVFGQGRADSYVFVLRIAMCRWRGEAAGAPLGGGILTIVGQWRGDLSRVKSLWVDGPGAKQGELFEWAPWQDESKFLAAFDQFRAGGQIPSWTPPMFLTPAVEGLVWLGFRAVFAEPSEQHRWWRFVCRVGAFSGAALLFGGLATVFVSSPALQLFCIATAAMCALMAGYIVFRHARNVRRFYSMMWQQHETIASLSVRHSILSEPPAAFKDDVLLAKYTADVESLGWRHWHDIEVDHIPAISSMTRAFVSADNDTILLVVLMNASATLRYFPSVATFLAMSYFADGTRLISMNQGGGYRKALDPTNIVRLFADAKDPATMIDRHVVALHKQIATGRAAKDLTAMDLLAQLQQEHERWVELMRRNGFYSWSAAFRQEFELIHPDFQESTDTQPGFADVVNATL